jgi:hypothetical protein
LRFPNVTKKLQSWKDNLLNLGIMPTVKGIGEVVLLTTFADEAERITAAAAQQEGLIKVRRNKEGPGGQDIHVEGKPTKV